MASVERPSVAIRVGDRLHSDIGSVAACRLLVPSDELAALKADFAPIIDDVFDFRGGIEERTAEHPTPLSPLHNQPGEDYRALIGQPLSFLNHTSVVTREFGDSQLVQGSYTLWNEHEHGCAELSARSGANNRRFYFLRTAAAPHLIEKAMHQPLDEAITLNILRDVVRQINRPAHSPKELRNMKDIDDVFTAAAPLVSFRRKGTYETFAGPYGSSQVTLTQYERQRHGSRRHTDFDVCIKATQPLDSSGAAFVSTQLEMVRDPKVRRPVALLKLGLQLAPRMRMDLGYRDTLLAETIDDYSQPRTFIDTMRHTLDALWFGGSSKTSGM